MTPSAEAPSPDLPPLERAVQVMDRLRSPGGCPWDATQTHQSLTRYLLEECYEVIEAIETGDHVLLREELGDLLLQVLFHARIAQEAPSQPFGIDEVAADLVAKLVRRHPHVFGDSVPGTAEELDATWEREKAAEKGRTSALEGVPVAQPALALTAKLISRAIRAGLSVAPVGMADTDTDAHTDTHTDTHTDPGTDEAAIGQRLFTVVQDAVSWGVDPEAALRGAARSFGDAVREAEALRASGDRDSGDDESGR